MSRPDRPRSREGGRAPAGRGGRPPAAPPPEPLPGPITALKEHPRRAGRYVVEIGGVPVGPVSVETIGDLKLGTGRVVDAGALARLLEAVGFTACYDRALDALARKGRPRRDLERYLKQREFTAPAIAAACERLERLGLLDDAIFAKAYVEGPARSKGFGTRRVVAELRRRGVDSAVVDRVLGAREDDGGEGEANTLTAAAERRARSMRSLAPEVAQRRLTGWLVRRGFGPGAAARAARIALGQR